VAAVSERCGDVDVRTAPDGTDNDMVVVCAVAANILHGVEGEHRVPHMAMVYSDGVTGVSGSPVWWSPPEIDENLQWLLRSAIGRWGIDAVRVALGREEVRR